MATTLTIGIRNAEDAIAFLATDFQNLRGMNNTLLYSRAATPGGKPLNKPNGSFIPWNVGFNDVASLGFIDPVTNQQLDRALNTEIIGSGSLNTNVTGRLCSGYVMVQSDDVGLSHWQSQIWKKLQYSTSSYEFISMPAGFYDNSILTSQFHAGSMWIGDNIARRALWNGSGNSSNTTALRNRLGIPVFGNTTTRIIPGTKMSGVFTETAVPTPSSYSDGYAY